MKKEIVIASGNKGKIKEAQEILENYEIIPMNEIGIEIDVEEDQNTFEGNARKKAETIAKKLGKQTLTQYEEAYIEKWLLDYGYNLNIIEIALKRSVYKSNPTFEYFNNIITNWHERGLKTPEEVYAFIEQREKQRKDTKQLEKQVAKASFDQRQYDNLAFLYANSGMNTEEPKVSADSYSGFSNIEGDINV